MPDTTWLQAVVPRTEWDKLNARRAKLGLKWGQILLPAAILYLDKVEGGEIKLEAPAPTAAETKKAEEAAKKAEAAAKKAKEKADKEAAKKAKVKADQAAAEAAKKAEKNASHQPTGSNKPARKTLAEIEKANKEKAEAASSLPPTEEDLDEVANIK